MLCYPGRYYFEKCISEVTYLGIKVLGHQSTHRIIDVSNYQIIELSNYRCIELSMYQNIDLSNYQCIKLSMYRIIELSMYRNMEVKRAHHCLRGRDVDLDALVAAGDAALKVGRRSAR